MAQIGSSERKNAELKRFDLRVGQHRHRALAFGVGWYDQDGNKRGSGDLDATDLKQIANRLEGGELFVVLKGSETLGEKADLGKLVTRVQYVVAPGIVYQLDTKVIEQDDDKRAVKLDAEVISADEVGALLVRK